MALNDKASNKSQSVKGKVKEAAGKATGDEELAKQGQADQVKASVKDAGEKVKDAARNVKRAAEDK